MNEWQDSTREDYLNKGLASRSGYGSKPALLIIDFSNGFTDPAVSYTHLPLPTIYSV